ncbi:MAG TPA: YciI family protein [Streptosporangiaceae bacterium]
MLSRRRADEVHDFDQCVPAGLRRDDGTARPQRARWTPDDFAALGAFMESFNQDLVESGELVDTRGLTAPAHARRIQLQAGVPVVTDGPYAEAEEVLAGYWIVECDSFDRATQIASRLTDAPGPEHLRSRAFADVRPLVDSRDEL